MPHPVVTAYATLHDEYLADPAIAPEIRMERERLGYQIFLSDPNSVFPGSTYFCGLKPYGRVGQTYPAPTELPAGFSTYRDAPTGSPFYPRARRLLRLGLDLTIGPDAPLEYALCTNWYFQRAADTAQLKRFGLENLYTTVFHHQLLHEFQPRLIICAGNGPISSYAGMLQLHGITTQLEQKYLGNARLRAAAVPGRVIVGVPHLSRYEVTEEVENFLREAVKLG